jgi:tight adherence protein C
MNAYLLVTGPGLARPFGVLGRALTTARGRARLDRWLAQAGEPAAWTGDRITVARGLGFVVGAAWGVGLGALYGGLPGGAVGAVVGALLGVAAPGVAVRDAAVRRQRELAQAYPDALDLLFVATEAGAGYPAALGAVARLAPQPVAGEAARLLADERAGLPRAAALRALAARTTVPDLRTLANGTAHAAELGLPLDEVLRRHADDVRAERWQRAEEVAWRVPARLLAPLALCLVPAVLLILFVPEVLSYLRG